MKNHFGKFRTILAIEVDSICTHVLLMRFNAVTKKELYTIYKLKLVSKFRHVEMSNSKFILHANTHTRTHTESRITHKHLTFECGVAACQT